ncbi:TetR/AcrR family transcriptional regulator [Tsukamurella sp. PLM1]|uniref:TetR/AcrR family transcriptional regulator n=1 Tax=Tsukamurella sp. PLM1 TaxID=2929795 RepID=UPI00206E86A4|nr:TetR/AcrR family transcriptional regulator [Tsukamurella sp. PLM1]BDH55119.1 hypothetical protein MTP03_00580 [Tsukamurella sp. PLM1]
MARLTRVEQRAQTRADLLIAARERFLEVGYAAAGLEEIADRAGYSKGAVYSNFVDKPNLCREVLQGIHEEKVGELSALVSGPGSCRSASTRSRSGSSAPSGTWAGRCSSSSS